MSTRALLLAAVVAAIFGGVSGGVVAVLVANEEERSETRSQARRVERPLARNWMMDLAFREADAMGDGAPDIVSLSCPDLPHTRPDECRAVVSGDFLCTRCKPAGRTNRVELVIDVQRRAVVSWRALGSDLVRVIAQSRRRLATPS